MSALDRPADGSARGRATSQPETSGEKGQAPGPPSMDRRPLSAASTGHISTASIRTDPNARHSATDRALAQGEALARDASPRMDFFNDPSMDRARDPGPAWYWDNRTKRWIRRESRDPTSSPGSEYTWDTDSMSWIPKPGSEMWTDSSEPPGPEYMPDREPITSARQAHEPDGDSAYSWGIWYWEDGRWWSRRDPGHRPKRHNCSGRLFYDTQARIWTCGPGMNAGLGATSSG